MNTDDFVSCLKESELEEGKMRAVHVKGKPILLAKVEGKFSVYQTVALTWAVRFKAES